MVLDMLYEEPYRVGMWVGFKDLTSLHNKWLKSMLYGSDDMTLLAHRGSYKTTVLSVFLALHVIIKPSENVIFFRKTDTDVSEVMRQTAKILTSGCINRLCEVLYGRSLKLVKSTDSEINTDLHTGIKGTSQIVGLGIGTSITGKHADVVVTDDIVNIKDRISRAEREKTKMYYDELQNIKNRGGRFINTGTPWHKDDAISVMPNVEKYDCYATGLIDDEALESLRESMTASLFAANYELKHIADTDAIFKAVKFTSEKADIVDGIAHIDASYGGADYTAFTVIKKRGDKCIAYGKLWAKHVDDCLDEIELLHRRFRAGTISCERNADKGYLAKELKERGFTVKTYHEKMNKFLKITTYLRREWNNIFWIDETDDKYLDQILDYTEYAEHDDAPDSAACLIRELENKGHLNKVHGGL